MSTASGLTIAVDGAYGATSGYVWAGGAFTSATSTLGQVNFGSGAATGTLFLSEVTGTATTAGAGLTGITFVTVSTATITALG